MNLLNYNKNNNYNDHVRKLFSKDEVLLSKWHINSDFGKESCLDRTVKDLNSYENFIFYDVFLKDNLIGFFGTQNNNFLTTLFLLPDYRKKEYVKQFWSFINEELKRPFCSSVYGKNLPVQKFFRRNGGRILYVKKDFSNFDNNIIYFIFEENNKESRGI